MPNNDIALRVFKRTKQDIILIWSCAGLTSDQIEHANILVGGKVVKYSSTVDFSSKTVTCLIKHDSNNLKAECDYDFTLLLGGESAAPLTAKITVLKSGLLPFSEKDRKEARVHNMAWDFERGEWVKLCAIKLKNGTYAIPTIAVDTDGNILEH